MLHKILFTAAVLLAIGGGVAGAATTLTTPPLPGGVDYQCDVLNVGKRPIEFDINIFSATGGNIVHRSCMGVQPGKVCGIAPNSQDAPSSSYCVVTLVKGSKRSIRASLTAKVGGAIAASAAAQ